MARSSAEAEYRVMASTANELIRIKQLLSDMGIETQSPMKMFRKAYYIESGVSRTNKTH
jgi:hypothetical protein